MQRAIHVFDNGVMVYDDHLIPVQRERYKKRNVHEAIEEEIFLEIIQTIPSQGCFVNIGSAIGYYPILAKKISPNLTIHAIEPLQQHRSSFMENIELNGFSSLDFHFHEHGISSTDGYANFRVKGFNSSIWLADPAATKDKLIKIATVSLDHFLTKIGNYVDLLQMDVQGLELQVLKGGEHSLQTGNVKTMLIGTHGPKIHEACANVVKQYGYIVEYEEKAPQEQPDGIIVASKGTQRLKIAKPA